MQYATNKDKKRERDNIQILSLNGFFQSNETDKHNCVVTPGFATV